VLNSDWWLQCLDLCVNLLETCAKFSAAVQYKLSTSGQHKIITELLIILTEVFNNDDNHDCLKTKSFLLTEQLANCLVVVVQKRSFPLQVNLFCT